MKPENETFLTVGILAIAGAVGRYYYPTTSDPFIGFGIALVTVALVREAWSLFVWWRSRP